METIINNTARASDDKPKKALLVAGMHRSGTSALTRILNILGVKLSENLLDPAPGNNDLGFFESKDLLDIHERLLESLGSSWDDYHALPRDWHKSDQALEFKREIIKVLRRDFGETDFFAVKDPRICRLLPFWLTIVRELNYSPLVVIPLRDPLEVAHSLKKRDDMPYGRSFLFWLRHVLDAERDSRGIGRSFLSYNDLMRDWVSVARKISADLEIEWPNSYSEAETRIDEFLQESLWRNRVDQDVLETRDDIVWWVKRTYFLLTNDPAAQAEKLTEELSTIRDHFETATLAFDPEIVHYRRKMDDYQAKAAKLEAEIGVRDEQIAKLHEENNRFAEQNNQLLASIAHLDKIYETQANLLSTYIQGQEEAKRCELQNRKDLDAFREEVDHLQQKVRQLDQNIISLHQSKSYKIARIITAPLRFVFKTLPSYLFPSKGGD